MRMVTNCVEDKGKSPLKREKRENRKEKESCRGSKNKQSIPTDKNCKFVGRQGAIAPMPSHRKKSKREKKTK